MPFETLRWYLPRIPFPRSSRRARADRPDALAQLQRSVSRHCSDSGIELFVIKWVSRRYRESAEIRVADQGIKKFFRNLLIND